MDFLHFDSKGAWNCSPDKTLRSLEESSKLLVCRKLDTEKGGLLPHEGFEGGHRKENVAHLH